ncbi:MAG: AAA family ATPase [Clostridium sp.]|uniref:DNA/RNA helicase domain-containing protein n=1 Tax=Clostridium sp. TaxID=1506 RepID=UPI0029037B36|nr:DNA/RNA helicase domain-containing protein [Clostridium sp.]MDU1586854.1 AAA family ATPase [Clostridium sp.]
MIGANKESDEYKAALKLKNIINDAMPREAIGEIVLFVSATLMGQEVKDVDILMIGIIKNYNAKLEFYNQEQEYVKDLVGVQSFCTTIEVKRHDIDGIKRIGTDFYVRYGEKLHCVTEQSNLQKVAAFNFYKRILSYSPFITNVIWFTQASRLDVKKLLYIDGKEIPSNVLGSEFEFHEIIQIIAYQRRPFLARSKYILNCVSSNCSLNKLTKALKVFSETKENMGELTRRRIEQITNKQFMENYQMKDDGKILIYRGRAGTGKTVGLIQTAIKFVEEKQTRVLILTYNKALVSDIRRLFALANLPDMFEEKCVSINTMQAYFYRLINQVLYDGKLDGKLYLDKYDDILSELIDFIELDEEAIEYIEELCSKDCQLNWEYVFIDEAQDWSTKEKELIIRLFSLGKIIVADGGQQFIRKVDICDWNTVRDRDNIKLKYCLRQKGNIVSFINHYSSYYVGGANKIIPSDKVVGGKIIILSDKNKLYDIHKTEMKKMVNSGNIAYDMLYLVPYTMVKKTDKGNHFKYISEFENNGIFLWDGTNEQNRNEYSIQCNEVRVLQYDSSRGLEGWIVCCLDFDVFIESKREMFDPNQKNNVLMLESADERYKKYLLNWSLIPLTRAIDTLIITLDNAESDIGRMLKKLADECRDYVTWI